MWTVDNLEGIENMKSLHNLFALVSLSLIACSNSESISKSPQDFSSADPSKQQIAEIEGMIHIPSGQTTIGSNNPSFRINEKPAMKVTLDYDYFIDIHEVTCGDYSRIAKKLQLNQFTSCSNDNLPLTNATYYDAVLYANAKSKHEKFDTVYTYREATFDNESHCINLEGLIFHPEIIGYRLPTEAEWIMAASKAWDVNKSWNRSNSEYKIHPVCSAGIDSTGLCDMAGNVMEWVNDWLGLLRDTTISNYVGAPDGGEIGERIVKGGYYAYPTSDLNLYSRGDIYTVTSSTRAEYVGFRLALGKISNALWMDNNGKSSESIITPIASSETIQRIIKTSKAKLAFRNDVSKKINYIDYNDGTLAVKELNNSIDAYHPEISPNGNWIAFCTNFEGISGKSNLYVQSIDTEKFVPTKLNVESAAIPRWRVLENGDTVIVYVTDAGNNKDEISFKSTSTWQVTFANGKFGSPQKLFDGAYHDGISKDNKLAVTGSKLLRARINEHDSIWYNGEQACNASLALDGTKRTAFLDFGGNTGRKFVGSNYSTHQQILIADSTGNLVQSFKAPNGFTFDHTEWATDNLNSSIVSTLVNTKGAHTKIVLVNPIDSSITDLAEGDELWHPNLWLKKAQVLSPADSIQADSETIDTTLRLDLDSAGVYYKSGVSSKAINMRIKMELLWKYKDTSNTIILGSSRPKNSIIPNQLSNPFYAVNMANTGFTMNEIYYLYFNYVQPHVRNLKYLIVSLDFDLWRFEYNGSNNFYHAEAQEIPGYIYDQNHQFWKNNYPKDLYRITYESVGGNTYAKKFRDTRGYEQFNNPAGWGETPYIAVDTNWMQAHPSLYSNAFKQLKEIVEDGYQNKIYIIGIIFPQSPKYKETGSFGAGGPQRSKAAIVIEDFIKLNKEFPNFILMDENKMGDHDYTDDMARDSEHLTHLGAIQITQRLDSLMQTLNTNWE